MNEMSEVWKFFQKLPDFKAKCNICDTKLKCCSTTSSLWNHLKSKHPASVLAEKNKANISSQNTMEKYLVPQRPCDQSRQKQLTNLILGIFYKDMLPIKFIESASFRKIISFTEPNYKIPSRKAISLLIEKQYIDIKKCLEDKLSRHDITKISITTDCWTSLNTESFITITCHFIDLRQWSMESAVLATRSMEETHTAIHLKEKIEAILNEYNLSEKTFTCVHDNAANINLAIESSVCFEEHIGCSAHTLQLVINTGLKNPRIQRALGAASRLVAHFKRSNKSTNGLVQKQSNMNLPQHKLIQSVVTRWNSTYDMCERLLEQRWAIVAVLGDTKFTKPSEARTLELRDEDWKVIGDICKCLKPFKTATETFSAEQHVSVSVVCPVIYALVNKHLKEDEEDSQVAAEFKKTVSDDLKKRFHYVLNVPDADVSVVLIAAFLDPRHKHLPYITNTNIKENIYSNLRTRIQLIKQQDVHHEPKRQKTSDFLGDGYECNSTKNDSANVDEIFLYLSLPLADISSNPLLWWKVNATVLPALSRIAGDYLSIPASSVPSERMFSSAGRLLNKLRCSLSSARVDQILFLNKNCNCESDISDVVNKD